MEKIQKKVSIVILVIVILLAIFFSAITFITDFMWFQEMGYVDVFLKELTTQLKVGVPTFLVITGLMFVYMTHLKKSYFKKIVSTLDWKSEQRFCSWLHVISWSWVSLPTSQKLRIPSWDVTELAFEPWSVWVRVYAFNT